LPQVCYNGIKKRNICARLCISCRTDRLPCFDREEVESIFMNIAFFLLPKNDVAYLNADDTVRQGLEKMRHYGYSAIPVIDDEGHYCGVISEGDFLWHFLSTPAHDPADVSMKRAEEERIASVARAHAYPPVSITEPIETLISRAADQNFVPVVDDLDIFIGIVTRRDIIRYYVGHDHAGAGLPGTASFGRVQR